MVCDFNREKMSETEDWRYLLKRRKRCKRKDRPKKRHKMSAVKEW